jgi:hypothetical protein
MEVIILNESSQFYSSKYLEPGLILSTEELIIVRVRQQIRSIAAKKH